MTRNRLVPCLMNRDTREKGEEICSDQPGNQNGSHNPEGYPVGSNGAEYTNIEYQDGHLDQSEASIVHKIRHEKNQSYLRRGCINLLDVFPEAERRPVET